MFRFQQKKRFAQHYLSVLDDLNRRYLLGGERITDAVADFDKELSQIESAQVWASEQFQAHDEVAQLAEDFADWGADLLMLRLSAQDYKQWATTALKAAQQLGLSRAESVHYGNLGITHRRLDAFDEAIDCLQNALRIAENIDNQELQGLWHGNLGNVYLDTGNLDAAEAEFQQALTIALALQDVRRAGTWLGNLGTLLSRRSRYDEAYLKYKEALSCHQQVGDRRSMAHTLDNMGNVLGHLGKLAEAIEQHQRALAISEALDDAQMIAHAAGNLAAGVGPSTTFAVDNTAPTVTAITRVDPDPTSSATVSR